MKAELDRARIESEERLSRATEAEKLNEQVLEEIMGFQKAHSGCEAVGVELERMKTKSDERLNRATNAELEIIKHKDHIQQLEESISSYQANFVPTVEGPLVKIDDEPHRALRESRREIIRLTDQLEHISQQLLETQQVVVLKLADNKDWIQALALRSEKRKCEECLRMTTGSPGAQAAHTAEGRASIIAPGNAVASSSVLPPRLMTVETPRVKVVTGNIRTAANTPAPPDVPTSNSTGLKTPFDAGSTGFPRTPTLTFNVGMHENDLPDPFFCFTDSLDRLPIIRKVKKRVKPAAPTSVFTWLGEEPGSSSAAAADLLAATPKKVISPGGLSFNFGDTSPTSSVSAGQPHGIKPPAYKFGLPNPRPAQVLTKPGPFVFTRPSLGGPPPSICPPMTQLPLPHVTATVTTTSLTGPSLSPIAITSVEAPPPMRASSDVGVIDTVTPDSIATGPSLPVIRDIPTEPPAPIPVNSTRSAIDTITLATINLPGPSLPVIAPVVASSSATAFNTITPAIIVKGPILPVNTYTPVKAPAPKVATSTVSDLEVTATPAIIATGISLAINTNTSVDIPDPIVTNSTVSASNSTSPTIPTNRSCPAIKRIQTEAADIIPMATSSIAPTANTTFLKKLQGDDARAVAGSSPVDSAKVIAPIKNRIPPAGSVVEERVYSKNGLKGRQAGNMQGSNGFRKAANMPGGLKKNGKNVTGSSPVSKW